MTTLPQTTVENPYHPPQEIGPSASRQPRYSLGYCGFGACNVLLGAVAMLGTFPGRTQGLGLITEYLLTDLYLSRNTFAAINLVATLVGALACFPAGMMIDRLGTRWSLVLVSGALGATCLVMSGFYLGGNDGLIGVLLLGLLVTMTRALGQSALSVVSMAVVGKWFKRHISAAMSVYSVLVGVGFMSAFAGVGHVVEERGWRDAWWLIGLALMFGLAPLAAIAVRSRPEKYLAGEDHGAQDLSLGTTGFTLAAAFRTPAFWIFALAASLYGLVASGLGLFNQHVLAEHGFDAKTYHNMLVLTTFAGLAGQVIAGVLGWRLSLARILAGAMFLYAAALGWLTVIDTITQLRVYAVMMGLAGGTVTVLFFAVWPQAFGRASLGRIQGAAQMLTVLASAVGPLLFSACHEMTGSYSPALYGLVPVILLLAIAAWCVRMPRPEETVAT